jgi:hypothetical protein
MSDPRKVQALRVTKIHAAAPADQGKAIALETSVSELAAPLLVVIPHAGIRDLIEALINVSEAALNNRRRAGMADDDYVPNVLEAASLSAGPSTSADHIGMIAVLPGGGDIGFQVSGQTQRR